MALFRSGDLFLEIYKNSLNKKDAIEAGKRYELFLKSYSQHSLAEKAYTQLYNLYKEELKDKARLESLQREWGIDFPR